MNVAVSVPDATFQHVDRAARELGMSRSEFFSRAAERWLAALDDDGTTDAINRALEGVELDAAFVEAAASALAEGDDPRRSAGGGARGHVHMGNREAVR